MLERSDDPLQPLARRIRDGDAAAFETVFRALHAPLCEVVDSYVRSQAVAEEIVQDLFMAVWMKRDRWEPTRSPRAYLFGAARNRAVQYLRHRAVARRWTARALMESDAIVVGSRVPSPDQTLEAAQTERAVRAAIDRLPSRARLAFVLQHEHEMSQAEIATAMGISVKGVEKLLASARDKLRVELRPLKQDETRLS